MSKRHENVICITDSLIECAKDHHTKLLSSCFPGLQFANSAEFQAGLLPFNLRTGDPPGAKQPCDHEEGQPYEFLRPAAGSNPVYDDCQGLAADRSNAGRCVCFPCHARPHQESVAHLSMRNICQRYQS